ncbi:M20 aminoacylase family protein [Pseudoroseomonas cervicalis]|uniref:Amidohydrolase n=1 Tax=Pseudoroseomonas cervicalis ATCC 49957 TaxID=525371 RepID=D5RJ23_9PROT|nr:M20 aminoacylase family protein [Pseudoroseomonas cervicalis]EFH12692.1 amidohydrolase [Pseudoroseomonas cervicalis ATCC 49957]
MPVLNRIAAFQDDMIAWRRDFHRHPELAFEEVRTSGIVAEKLREFGVDEVVTGIAGTGVVGVIRGNAPGKAIGLRADMDALPILEKSGVEYASTIPGKMHACGHDGHTTMLLGAAKYLAETRNFAGTVHVIFQPAEEMGGGAEVMVKEGLFERFPMERVFAIHNWPGIPAGEMHWRAGPVMAAVADIEITITGKGAHGAMPHMGNDPVVIAAQIVTALQSVVARNVEPVEAGVVTIGKIEGGNAFNVIPETVSLRGTARWFRPEVGDVLEKKVVEIASGIATAFGASAEVRFFRMYPATINDAEATELAARAAATVVGEANTKELPKPTMGGEDFAFMLNAKSGSYLMLGGGRGASDAGLHHPKYDFNDEILPVGASFFATLAEQLLSAAGQGRDDGR